VVWLDAHADLNVPTGTETGSLGGMALSGPQGWWDSTLGGSRSERRALPVGARDLDPAEIQPVTVGCAALVPPGPGIGERLAAVLHGRPAFPHVDCNVLEPGLAHHPTTVSRAG
jgi:arginase family enzyme